MCATVLDFIINNMEISYLIFAVFSGNENDNRSKDQRPTIALRSLDNRYEDFSAFCYYSYILSFYRYFLSSEFI